MIYGNKRAKNCCKSLFTWSHYVLALLASRAFCDFSSLTRRCSWSMRSSFNIRHFWAA